MSHIVVTGAGGFIGRYVSLACSHGGHVVTGVGHGESTVPDASSWGIAQWHRMDIRSASSLSLIGKPDVIIHCAGGSSVGASVQRPGEDFERTVGSLAAVLEYVRTSSPDTKIVYPSSAAVYGETGGTGSIMTNVANPVSPYGFHKKIAEDLCRSYTRNFRLNVAVVRLFSVYGPHLRKQLLWDACLKLTSGDSKFGGTGAEVRDWFHAQDAARLLLCAAEHANAELPLVDGCTGNGLTNRELLAFVARELRSAIAPTFSGETRAGDPSRYVGDPRPAQAWGWAPAWQWQEGVRQYVRWFREVAA
jgi:UDP-glucose 4-epimerase